jgi:ribonucleoside-diphosphate reductase alpha chain
VHLISEACDGLEGVTEQSIYDDTCRNLFDGIKEKDVATHLVMSSRTLIEKEPNYSYAAARLLMDSLRFDALGFLGMDTNVATQAEMADLYPSYFQELRTSRR